MEGWKDGDLRWSALLFLALGLSALVRAEEPTIRALWLLPGNEQKTREVDAKELIQACRIISQDNHNSRFWISVTPKPSPAKDFLGLILEGDGFRLKSQGHGATKDVLTSISFYADAPTAAKVAKAMSVPLEKRKHPGHRLATRFIAGDMNKTTFVTLEITNVGDATVTFMDGGRNRGRRNNQFSFAGFHNGKPMPDVGDPTHFGGLAGFVTLKKGEVFTKKVDLAKWFDLSGVGYYNFTGTFYIELMPPDGSHPILWSDMVGAEFMFQKTRPTREEREF